VERNFSLVVALPLRPLSAVGRCSEHDGSYGERTPRSLWLDFTPHRLIRRYSEYAWLNNPGSPTLAS
jgi:hypothetical protein